MSNDRCVARLSSFAFCGFSVLFFSLSFLSSCPPFLSLFSLSRSFYTYLCVPPPPIPYHLSLSCSASLAPQPPTPPPSPAVRMQCVRPSLPAGRPAAVRAPLHAHTPLISIICSSRMLLESVHIDTNPEPALFNSLSLRRLWLTRPPPPPSTVPQPLVARPHGHTRSSSVSVRLLPRAEPRCAAVAGQRAARGLFGREGRWILAFSFVCLIPARFLVCGA